MGPDLEPHHARLTSISLRLGAILAIAGGFLDAYTYVSRNRVFANSQTGNAILFGVEAARGEWTRALQHVPPILAFVVGVFVAETLKRPGVARVVRWPVRAAMVLEIGVLVVVGLLPPSFPDSAVTVTIAFVASLQVSMFRTLIRWPYNSAMTTGNLRTIAQAAFVAIVDRDRDAAEEARAFSIVIASFVLGGLTGAWLTIRYGAPAIWIAALLLAAGLSLFIYDDWLETRA